MQGGGGGCEEALEGVFRERNGQAKVHLSVCARAKAEHLEGKAAFISVYFYFPDGQTKGLVYGKQFTDELPNRLL